MADSAAELLASDRLARVRQCASDGCTRLFLYANSRRRWCDQNLCGNRAKGRRYHDMVRRAVKEAGAMTYFELTEGTEERISELKKEREEIERKNARLRQVLKELEAGNGAADPADNADSSDGES